MKLRLQLSLCGNWKYTGMVQKPNHVKIVYVTLEVSLMLYLDLCMKHLPHNIIVANK